MSAAVQPTLFDQPADAVQKHSLDIRMLVPLATELAERVGQVGITVADLRAEAERRGLFKPGLNTRDRSLSYLGAVMKAAGLVATDRTRRSFLPHSHGNRHVVHLSPRYAR
jgi:hypothetical protein